MATVRTVKDVTLFFLHLICIVLSGWYGFHNLSGRPFASVSAAPAHGHGHTNGNGNGQTPLLRTSLRIQQSARLSIAFGSLTLVNVLLFVAVKFCDAKPFLLRPTNFLTTCLSFALGGALIVMLGQATVLNKEFSEADLTLASIVIAFTLILILMQASTLEFTRKGIFGRPRLKETQDERLNDDFFVSPHRSRQDYHLPHRNLDPVELAFFSQGNTMDDNLWPARGTNHTATIHRHATPSMRITVSALDTAKKNLRKSPVLLPDLMTPDKTGSSMKLPLPTLDENPGPFLHVAKKDCNNNSRNLSTFPFEFSYTTGDDDVFFSRSSSKTPNQSVPLSLLSFHSLNESFVGKNISSAFKSTPINENGGLLVPETNPALSDRRSCPALSPSDFIFK